MRYIIALILTISIASISSATELSKALDKGKKLGWNHKDTYRPYPILFIHGLGGHCVQWNDPDNSKHNQGPDDDDGMTAKLLPYFKPYWKTKPEAEDEGFKDNLIDIPLSNRARDIAKIPIKTYLETIEFSDSNASISELGKELKYRILGKKIGGIGDRKPNDAIPEDFKPLLQEYYEDTHIKPYSPLSYPNDKVILVCHSAGGVVAREYLTNPEITESKHVAKLIMIQTPNFGSYIAAALNSMGINSILETANMGNGWGKVGAIAETIRNVTCHSPNNAIAFIVCHILGVDRNGELMKDLRPDSPKLAELNRRGRSVDGTEYIALIGVVAPKALESPTVSGIIGFSVKNIATFILSPDLTDENKRSYNRQLDNISNQIDLALGKVRSGTDIEQQLKELKALIDELKGIQLTMDNFKLLNSKVEKLRLKNKQMEEYLGNIENHLADSNDIATFTNLINSINPLISELISIILAPTDNSDGIVTASSQAFLTSNGGQISAEETSGINASAFHSTLPKAVLRGGYDGKISIDSLLKQIDAEPLYKLTFVGFDEDKNFVVEGKCYDYLPANTVVSILLKGEYLHDAEGTITNRPLMPLIDPFLSENGKYNSGFSFRILPEDVPKPIEEDGTNSLSIVLRNPAGIVSIDGVTAEKIVVPVHYSTPFRRDGTNTIVSSLPLSSIDSGDLVREGASSALSMPVPKYTQARVSHFWWPGDNPSNASEVWIATGKKVDRMNNITYRNLGNYTSPYFRHRVFLESINYTQVGHKLRFFR